MTCICKWVPMDSEERTRKIAFLKQEIKLLELQEEISATNQYATQLEKAVEMHTASFATPRIIEIGVAEKVADGPTY